MKIFVINLGKDSIKKKLLLKILINLILIMNL